MFGNLVALQILLIEKLPRDLQWSFWGSQNDQSSERTRLLHRKGVAANDLLRFVT